MALQFLNIEGLSVPRRIVYGLLTANGPVQLLLFFLMWKLLVAVQLFELFLLLGLSGTNLILFPHSPETLLGIVVMTVILILLVQGKRPVNPGRDQAGAWAFWNWAGSSSSICRAG